MGRYLEFLNVSSPPSSAEVKYARSYTSTSPIVFIARFLIKHRICLHNVVLN